MSTIAPQKAELGKKSLGFWSLEGGAPESGRELDDLGFEPDRQECQHITQVGPGLDVVHATAGDERDDGRVPLSAIVSRTEQPIFTTDRLVTKLKLRGIVVEP